jgi:hypothetical protein
MTASAYRKLERALNHAHVVGDHRPYSTQTWCRWGAQALGSLVVQLVMPPSYLSLPDAPGYYGRKLEAELDPGFMVRLAPRWTQSYGYGSGDDEK